MESLGQDPRAAEQLVAAHQGRPAQVPAAFRLLLAATCVLLALLAAPQSARGETIYAASTYLLPEGDISFRLLRFDSATPQSLEAVVPITGHLEYEAWVSLEFDPRTRALHGFSISSCQLLCPTMAFGPSRILPESGASWFLNWPGFPHFETAVADYDIDPQSRELRFFGQGGRNLRYRLDSFELIEDQPFDQPGPYVALAHTWPETGGVETFAIRYSSATGTQLARIGGPGGSPPASTGEVTIIGPLAVEGSVGGFDISPGGAAYLSTFEALDSGSAELFVNHLYTIDLATASVQELGLIGAPELHAQVTGIAVAPEGPGPGVLEIPALSTLGIALFVLALGVAALLGPLRRARGGSPERAR